jgi:DNA-binding MarR family transcriptional regulator
VTPLVSRGRYGGRVNSPEMTDQDLLANWELITRAVARTQERVLARIEEAGLPSQWFAALHLLLRSPDHRMPMSRLARELSMTSGGFTKLADRMGQDGLIDRRNSAGDRRVVYAALTDDGLRVARRTERQYRTALREHVLDVLTVAELAVLSACARTLAEAHAESAHDAAHPEVAPARDPALPDRRARGARRVSPPAAQP